MKQKKKCTVARCMCNCSPQMRGEIKEEENRKKKLFEKFLKIFKFNGNSTLTDSSSLWDTTHNKYEETVSRYITIKLFKISIKRKS